MLITSSGKYSIHKASLVDSESNHLRKILVTLFFLNVDVLKNSFGSQIRNSKYSYKYSAFVFEVVYISNYILLKVCRCTCTRSHPEP